MSLRSLRIRLRRRSLAGALCLALGVTGCERTTLNRAGHEEDSTESPIGRESARASSPRQDTIAWVDANEFVSYNAADSVVRLKLWAGYGGKNSAWNFSGYYDGNAAFVVPLGWRVEATFQNLDANVPHSAGIVEAADSIPFSGDQATLAFPGATTRAFVAGVSSRIQPQVFKFEADRAGRFWVYCGVAGHGLNGMWIWFEVSADAQVPELRSYE